jgi:hypothetical protein
MRKYVINSRGCVRGSWLPACANRLSLRAKVKGPNRVENGPLEWPCWPDGPATHVRLQPPVARSLRHVFAPGAWRTPSSAGG